MFRVKICGVTSVEDARLAVEAGADAVGLNFYPPSPRAVRFETAGQIVRALPEGVLAVGVFVDAGVDEVEAARRRLGLHLLQLHGEEPPETAAQVGADVVVKAVRCGEEGLAPALSYLEACRRRGVELAGLLLDTYRPGRYGGTGATFDWALARRLRAQWPEGRIAIAGGLTPENVAAAVAAAGPDGVDAASGVESAPGRKDPERVRRFVAAARAALDQWAGGR